MNSCTKQLWNIHSYSRRYAIVRVWKLHCLHQYFHLLREQLSLPKLSKFLNLILIIMWILALIVLWALIGRLSGFFVAKKWGLVRNIIIWIVWAVVWWLVMNLFGASWVTWFNLYSILVWILWAVIFVSITRAIS